MNKLLSVCRFFKMPLLALVLVLAGGGLLSLTLPKLVVAYHNQTWPSVIGQVLEARWDNKLVSKNAARPNFKFTPKIEYSYTVNNTEYKSTTIRLNSFDELDRKLGITKLTQYPTGRKVAVYYNPSNPGVSCLEPEKPTLISVLGLILGVVSFYSAFALMKQVIKS
jgi:Protein of unknown function (DUF3592)